MAPIKIDRAASVMERQHALFFASSLLLQFSTLVLAQQSHLVDPETGEITTGAKCPLLPLGPDWVGHGRVLFQLSQQLEQRLDPSSQQSAPATGCTLQDARRFKASVLQQTELPTACMLSGPTAAVDSAASNDPGLLLEPHDDCLRTLAPSLLVAQTNGGSGAGGPLRRLQSMYYVPADNLTCCCSAAAANGTASCCCASDPATCCPVASESSCPGNCTWVYVLALGIAVLLCFIVMVLVYRYRVYKRNMRLRATEYDVEHHTRVSFDSGGGPNGSHLGLRTIPYPPESPEVVRSRINRYVRTGFTGGFCGTDGCVAKKQEGDCHICDSLMSDCSAGQRCASTGAALDSEKSGQSSDMGGSSSNSGSGSGSSSGSSDAGSANGACEGYQPQCGPVDCPVCLEEITDPEEWLRFRCNHGLCRVCLLQLLKSVSCARFVRCPTCRLAVVPNPTTGLVQMVKRQSMELMRQVEEEVEERHRLERLSQRAQEEQQQLEQQQQGSVADKSHAEHEQEGQQCEQELKPEGCSADCCHGGADAEAWESAGSSQSSRGCETAATDGSVSPREGDGSVGASSTAANEVGSSSSSSSSKGADESDHVAINVSD